MSNKYNIIQSIARKKGILRPRDLDHIHREYLIQLYQQGILEKIGRGLYILPDLDIDENFSFAQVCKKWPNATISLLSALRFHQLTTQLPYEIWVAIPNRAHHPLPTELPLRVVRFSGAALSAGIETKNIYGVKVPIFKGLCHVTVVDDGLSFLADTVKGIEIREAKKYQGVRISLTAMLGKARLKAQANLNLNGWLALSWLFSPFLSVDKSFL